MIRVRHTLAAFAAASLAAGSVTASAAPVRDASPVDQNEQIAGVSTVLLLALAAAAAFLVFVVIDDDDKDAPTSP